MKNYEDVKKKTASSFSSVIDVYSLFIPIACETRIFVWCCQASERMDCQPCSFLRTACYCTSCIEPHVLYMGVQEWQAESNSS